MGNDQGNKRGQKPQEAHITGLNEPLQVTSVSLQPGAKQAQASACSLPSTDYQSWDPGSPPRVALPSLEMAIQQAFQNISGDFDPKSAQHLDSQLEQSFDLSELPAEDEEEP